MKRNRRRLPIPQYEFGYVPDTFTLIQETGLDGERLARERAEAEQARHRNDAGRELTTPNHSHGWTGNGSAAFLLLGTRAVPKPRRWASRQPRPAPKGKPSGLCFRSRWPFHSAPPFQPLERIPVIPSLVLHDSGSFESWKLILAHDAIFGGWFEYPVHARSLPLPSLRVPGRLHPRLTISFRTPAIN